MIQTFRLRFFLPLLATGAAFLSSCAQSSTSGGTRSGGKSSNSQCCLVDPGHGALLMPDRADARAALENWVNKNAHHLSITGGAKPRFILLYVSRDMVIKDQMPVADQSSPTAPHKLTDAEVASLRACFNGGTRVRVDWPTKSVKPL